MMNSARCRTLMASALEQSRFGGFSLEVGHSALTTSVYKRLPENLTLNSKLTLRSFFAQGGRGGWLVCGVRTRNNLNRLMQETGSFFGDQVTQFKYYH